MVHVDPATGKADSPDRKKLRTYLGIVVRDKVPETPFEFQTSEGVKGNGANDKSYMDSLLTTGLYQGHGGQDLNLEKKMTWWRIMGRKRMLGNRFLTLVRLFKYLMRSLHSSVHLGRGHWWFMC